MMKRWAAALGSLLIVALGQPAWVPWLAPVAAVCGYALFWREALRLTTLQRRFWAATLWFAVVQAVQLSWMTTTEFQGVYILFVYGVLAILLGVQFGLLSLLIDRIPHMAVAALWVILEWSRLYVLCGFSWNPSGMALAAFVPSMQIASVFGVLGLSFLVMLTNLAVLFRRKPVWVAIALVPYIFGAAHLFYHAPEVDSSPKLHVALVQTALLPPEKSYHRERPRDFVSPHEQWARILRLLQSCKAPVDLIVLPEYAVPFPASAAVYSAKIARDIMQRTFGESIKEQVPDVKVPNHFWMREIARHFSAEVIGGLDTDDGAKSYSSAFHYTPNGMEAERYDKRVLVPLAEYLPLEALKPFTARYGIVGFFEPGLEAKVFSGKVRTSPSICYEETFAHLVREGRQKGAEMLVNLTNDGWYPGSRLPQQHFDHGRLRAVENGVPLLRACNTGVTAAVDSLGRIVGEIREERRAAVLEAAVPRYTYTTLYTFWGDFGILAVSVLSLLVCGWRWRRA
jgi:apolipoprotein N-acyltransferase